MKKIIGMIIVLLFFGVFFIGCSVDKENNFSEQKGFRRNRENFNKEGMQKEFEEFKDMVKKEVEFGENFDRERFGDKNLGEFDEENVMQMREEMQKKMMDVCQGKIEGDVCQLENQMGEMHGVCAVENENLICRFERPKMPMR